MPYGNLSYLLYLPNTVSHTLLTPAQVFLKKHSKPLLSEPFLIALTNIMTMSRAGLLVHSQ